MDKKLVWGLLLLMLLPMAYAIQVNSSTDIYSFEVLNCTANATNIGCAATDVLFSCNITPFAYIDYTLIRIDGVDHPTNRSNEIFSYNWHKAITTIDINTTVDFERGQIHDISDGDSLFFPNVSVNLLCDSCDWNITSDPCQINDTHFVQYVGDGSPNCTSYNATESCDYCTPSWEITSTCQQNNTEFRTYEDDNICYNLTSLYSDSCNYAHTDCDTLISCDYLVDDMTCDFDVNPLINIVDNKIYWKCSTGDTQNYNCVSYVKQDGAIIQTSPQQTSYSSGIIPREQENREFFTAQNGLVNPYFTTENLNSNVTYVFGVECSYNNGTLVSEHYVTPMYRNMDSLAARSVWITQNAGYIIGGIIFLIIIIAVIALVVRR